jgi:twitching motility protein PilT
MNLRDLLSAARRHDASDVHILAGFPPMFRIHGDIVPAKGDGLSPEEIESMLDDCLLPTQKERLERDWQLCVSLVYPNTGRARLTVYRRNGRWELAIRMSELSVRTRQQLGLPAIVEDLARKPNGLVILTGPTGVGKTTTLHYMLDLINAERSSKIITIEDPIEYVHSFKRSIIVQQEVLVDVQDFAGALRHVLRQDPDVIAVGEMRDAETIYTALTAAETGHLVIATLHTPGAPEVVQRIVSAFPEGRQNEIRIMLAGTLQAVISQQLLPRASDKGRVLCCEILVGTHAVRHHIRSGDEPQLYSEIQSGRKSGMVTADQSLLDLYQAGEISYDTMLTHARHADQVKKRTVKEAV